VAGRGSRRSAEDFFPTLVRYVGIGLMVYAALIDMGRNPALIPAATGMIFFKTIYGHGREDDK
jgi:hypothetical protein